MRAHFLAGFAIVLSMAISVAAQQRGGAPAAPPMTMTVSGFADGGRYP